MGNIRVERESVRGRYAPSPTGMMHIGNARTALAAWLAVRKEGGTFVWRLEDLDPPRILPGAAEAAQRDLARLGIDWDEGPDIGGPFAPYIQSERYDSYEAALRRLYEAGRLFPCTHSRKDLQALSSAPHGREGMPPYPQTLRPRSFTPGWFDRLSEMARPDAVIRFLVHDRPITFHDRVFGPLEEQVSETVGDFVLKRRDGLYAYQLAVVVDDIAMQITDLVRGSDLLHSTARQIQLIEALGGTPPRYAHVPLVLTAAGEKLSKRDKALTLRSLEDARVAPERIVGYMAWTLGLLEQPTACRAEDLIPLFAWEKLTKADWILPEDLTSALLQL